MAQPLLVSNFVPTLGEDISDPARYSTTDITAPYYQGVPKAYAATLADSFTAPNNAATGDPTVAGGLAFAPNQIIGGDPDLRELWAYNLIPGTAPHVIIKFSEVEYVNENNVAQTPITEPRYLTLQTFKYSAAGPGHSAGDIITTFVKNNVYTLSDIRFDIDDIEDVPEEDGLDVLIQVNLMHWIDNEIEWSDE